MRPLRVSTIAIVSFALLSQAAFAQAPYRTVVIFGDTQKLVDGFDGGYGNFLKMVKWVVDNRDAENIDFVLHVGDVIQSGIGCINGGCNASQHNAINAQWTRFNFAWKAFDTASPPIPYAIVRGNHDNKGLSGATNGFAQNFGRAKFAGQSTLVATCDPLTQGPFGGFPCANDIGHMWRFQLGPVPVLVAGLPDRPNIFIQAWFKSILLAEPETPAIILSHRQLRRTGFDPLWTSFVEYQGQPTPFTRQVFLTAMGHYTKDRKDLTEIAGHRVLKVEFDRQYFGNAPAGAGIARIRFYFDPSSLDEVEGDTLAPSIFGPLPTGKLLPLTPFSVHNDIDHDGFLDADDNCPETWSADQSDLDEDGLGDVCDDDKDGDGAPNDWELLHGLDPLVADSSLDPDGEGLSNLDEYLAGTDPNLSDSDLDGWDDGDELAAETSPLDAEETPLDVDYFPYEDGLVTGVDNTGWLTVQLRRTNYPGIVVIATPIYTIASPPMATRIRNAGSGSFELRVDRTDGSDDPVAAIDVHYLVVKRGVYDAAVHGETLEAVTYLSSLTAPGGNSDWHRDSEERSYQNSYVNPVVLGQVMSYNDSDFSLFFSSGRQRQFAPSPTQLYLGKHTARDSDHTREDETIGYLVMEAGSGRLGGRPFTAGVVPDGQSAIFGVGDAPPYTVGFTPVPGAGSAAVSQTGMDGVKGGWAVLYGAGALSDSTLDLAIDESEGKRRHSNSEQAAYLVLSRDSDGDRVADFEDNCLGVANLSQYDADMDGVGNHCDADFDQSGVVDDADFVIFFQCQQLGVGSSDDPACSESDMDGDGTVGPVDFNLFDDQCGANCVDFDDDGIVDAADNCRAVANAFQADSDHDGIGDACDNCSNVANGPLAGIDNQRDATASFLGSFVPNGYGDSCEEGCLIFMGSLVCLPGSSFPPRGASSLACQGATFCYDQFGDGDTDNDGVPNFQDNCNFHVNPTQADDDNDGVGNACIPWAAAGVHVSGLLCAGDVGNCPPALP